MYDKLCTIFKGDELLSHFIFSIRGLSLQVKSEYVRLYLKFKESNLELNPPNILKYIVLLDKDKTFESETLVNYYRKLKNIAIKSLDYQEDQFAKLEIDFFKKTEDKFISHQEFLAILEQVKRNPSLQEEHLLLELIWALAAKPFDILTLLYCDFQIIDGEKVVVVFRSKLKRKTTVSIDNRLWDKVVWLRREELQHQKLQSQKAQTHITVQTQMSEKEFVFKFNQTVLNKRFNKIKKATGLPKLTPFKIYESSVEHRKIINAHADLNYHKN